MEVTWTELKKFLDARLISVQYAEVGGNYWLKAIDGRFELECQIPLDPLNEETADFIANYKSKGNKPLPQQSNSFTSKFLPNGKSLFRRVTGITEPLAIGSNTILFTVPYAWTKITGAQIIGGEIGDTVNLFILDSTTGTYTTVPNYQLNQFGFNVNIAKDFYDNRSQFDADLYIGMQIKIVYTSVSEKNIGINLILDEVK